MNGSMLIAVMLVCGSEGFTCPSHCFCYKWNGLSRTDCVGKNLFNTFVGFSHQTQILDLSKNVLTILHGNEFQDANLRLLQDLRISNNRLHKIDKLSFNGLELLQNLDLSFNSIEYLTPTTFRYNRQLKTLNVSHNPLGVMNDGPFLSSSSLRILDVANCQFGFFTRRMFSELTALQFLNVSRNLIKQIKPDVVEGLKNLKYLDVSRNDLGCNDQTAVFFQTLARQGTRLQTSCQMSQKIMLVPAHTQEEPHVDEEEFQEHENVSQIFQKTPDIFDDVRQFFTSIPSVYVLLCGIQFGILIGAIVTYFCMKNSRKFSGEGRITERPVLVENDSERFTSALILLNTPPGTPPSPYHSRIFTDFPLLPF